MCRNSRYKRFYERYHFQARALNAQLVCIIPHEYELNVDYVATNCILSTVLGDNVPFVCDYRRCVASNLVSAPPR